MLGCLGNCKILSIQHDCKERNIPIEKIEIYTQGIYNKDFIFNWLQTQNCKAWIHEHDKTLGYRSEYVKQANDVTIYYENGDVYNGSLKMGKRNGNGSYREISAKRVYNGEWVNDERNGVGSLTSEDLQYIYDGEWKNGMMNGNGQLIDKKSKYSGTFIK